jgi:hypothetical protein
MTLATSPAPQLTKLELARSYAARGWKVLILRPYTRQPYNNWRFGLPTYDPDLDVFVAPDLLDYRATDDPRLIEAWLEEYPDAGLAIDCSESGLFAFEVHHKPDEDKLGFTALAGLQYFHSPGCSNYFLDILGVPPLPDTEPSVEELEQFEKYLDAHPNREEILNPWGPVLRCRNSNGGQCLIYTAPPGSPFAATDFAEDSLLFAGLDVKWDGYITVPYGDTRRVWLNDVEPGPMPRWLQRAIQELCNPSASAPAREHGEAPSHASTAAETSLDSVEPSIDDLVIQLGPPYDLGFDLDLEV